MCDNSTLFHVICQNERVINVSQMVFAFAVFSRGNSYETQKYNYYGLRSFPFFFFYISPVIFQNKN